MKDEQVCFSQQIEMQPRDSLRANPRNVRTHTKRQLGQLANSIKSSGVFSPIVIDENGMVLAGNARLMVAEMLGVSVVPTIRVFLADTLKRAFVLADNRIAENAGWDNAKLVDELEELAKALPPLNLDLKITGFEAAEIDALFADLGGQEPIGDDVLPQPEPHAVTRRGELWHLADRHRIVCGDARCISDLDRLMGGAKAHAACMDPPYNLRVSSFQGRGRNKFDEFAHASGEMTRPQYIGFLKDSLSNAARVSTEGAVHYVFADWRHCPELFAAGESVYGSMLNLCVWAKTNAGQGSFYRSQHEIVGVFRVGSERHQNNIRLGRFGRNRSNLWTYAGVNGFGPGRSEALAFHPTVKPVAMLADAMRDSTTKGELVLDLFLGSGSTILAAEKVGRRAYGMEYEPRYVDVSVRRWESVTKLEAVLDGDGRTYAEIKAEREAGRQQDDATQSGPISATGGPEHEHPPDWSTLCEPTSVLPPSGRDR